MFSEIRSKIVHSKMFVHRAMGWMSLANAGMLLFLTLSQFEKYGIDINITNLFVPIFLITLAGLALFGFLEDKLGFYREEAKASATRNPYFNEILSRLDSIEAKTQ